MPCKCCSGKGLKRSCVAFCRCELLSRVYTRYRLKPWLLLIVLWLYVVSGAYFLSYQEAPAQEEIKLNKTVELEAMRAAFAQNFSQRLLNTTELLLFVEPERSEAALQLLERALADYENLVGLSDFETEWTFLNATVYALSVITTVGHSGLRPRTLYGQIFAFCYTLIGVPLLLATVSEFAKLLYLCMELCYTRCQPPEDAESTHARSLFSSEANYTYNLAKPPQYLKLVLACLALVVWLLGNAALLWFYRPASFPSLWSAVFCLAHSFFTVEVPFPPSAQKDEYFGVVHLAILNCAAVALIFVSLTARVLSVLTGGGHGYGDLQMTEPELHSTLPRDHSATLLSSGITAPCAKIRDRMAHHPDIHEVVAFRPSKHQTEVNSSGQTTLIPRSSSAALGASSATPRSPRDSATLSLGIREDERVWLAEATQYSEQTLAREIKAAVAEIPPQTPGSSKS